MSNSPVRWALAGFGSGGRVFHAPLLAAAAEVDLAAVVTGNADRRAAVEHDFPGLQTVPDLAALPDLGIEAVTITTPPGTHTSLAHRAIELGLGVVVDKPFALDSAAAAELIDHARLAGSVLTVYQNRRWDSDFLTVRQLIDGGTLGVVHRFTSRIDRFRPVKVGWATSPQDGGGTLLDLGPHLVDQALHLFGPVVRVHAQVSAVRAGSGADDEIELHLEHGSGVLSTIAAGMASPAEAARFQVNGSLGGFVISGFDVQEAQLKAGESPASLGSRWGVEPPSSYGRLTTAEGTETVQSQRGRWDMFYPAAAAAVRGTGPVPVPATDALATAKVLDAARLSSAEHRVVPVPVL